jgi:hypothetical protein
MFFSSGLFIRFFPSGWGFVGKGGGTHKDPSDTARSPRYGRDWLGAKCFMCVCGGGGTGGLGDTPAEAWGVWGGGGGAELQIGVLWVCLGPGIDKPSCAPPCP